MLEVDLSIRLLRKLYGVALNAILTHTHILLAKGPTRPLPGTLGDW